MNSSKTMVIMFLFCFISLLSLSALAAPLPDTGQTKCYDDIGNEIICPSSSENLYGQDGNYTINPMSYTKLDADGNNLPDDSESWIMVRDNVTGLIWENKQDMDGTKNYANPHDTDNTYIWYDSNPAANGGHPGTPGDGISTFDTEQFINALNAEYYGGHNDWRLPNIKELISIVNYNFPYPGPTVNATYFANIAAFWYWSSTIDASGTSGAWIVSFFSGAGYYSNPPGSHFEPGSVYARAVRGGQSTPLNHLVINGDGTVTDTKIGLMWQQDTPDNTYTWNQALSYCENSNLAGYSDWRLPNKKELGSLVDYSRYNLAIDPGYFPDTAASWYWSSTTYAGSKANAWVVHFNYGYDYSAHKSNSYDVRAVRGGESGSSGHPVILAPEQASIWDAGVIMPILWNIDGLGANVKISLSREGSKNGSFETIIAITPNDGQENWIVDGSASVNCFIKIEQADNPVNWASDGLFIIQEATNNIFYEQYYLSRHPDVAKAVDQGVFATGWNHFLQYGAAEGRSFTEPADYATFNFNEAYYLARYEDVAKAVKTGMFGTGWEHFVQYGRQEGRTTAAPDNYANFNEGYYLAKYPDVANAVDAGLFGTGWEHFLQYGLQEGRTFDKPAEYGDFNELYYLSRNLDVARAVEDGLLGTGWEHYTRWGRNEGRSYAKPNDYEGLAYGGLLP